MWIKEKRCQNLNNLGLREPIEEKEGKDGYDALFFKEETKGAEELSREKT